MTIDYDFYGYDDETYGYWDGDYTIGSISCRGTRVWFKNITILEKDDYDYHFNIVHDTEYDDENYAISNDSLQEIIDLILGNVLDDFFIELKNVKDIDTKFTQLSFEGAHDINYINEFKKNYEYICCDSPTNIIHFINNKQKILDELHKVVLTCNLNRVTWKWT